MKDAEVVASSERLRGDVVPGADDKRATLHLHLIADSSYDSEGSYRISANQWAAILRICEGATPTPHDGLTDTSHHAGSSAEDRRSTLNEGLIEAKAEIDRRGIAMNPRLSGSSAGESEPVNRDRPATEPGGMVCESCDEIFIGEPWHWQCAVCVAPPAPSGGEMVLVPRELLDRFPEINPSNYEHDDACALNSWGCEVLSAASPAPPHQGGKE